jgi:3-phosphoshikimate 1-carboxyvinyltransferase
MDLTLQKSTIVNHKSTISITGSKSESNRLLLLQALYPELKVENLSNWEIRSTPSHIGSTCWVHSTLSSWLWAG